MGDIMGKKNILIMTGAVLLIALFCNLSLVSASDLSWNAGDIIVWGHYDDVSIIVKDLNADTTLEEIVQGGYDFQYNITAYDSVSKQYDYIYSDPSGTYSPSTRSFDWEDFADADLTSDNGDFINVNYIYDENTNHTILTTFTLSVNFLNYRLIESNWNGLNIRFAEVFNESYLLDTVNDPWSSTVYNFTWGTFLDNIDYKIMGRSKLKYALNQFKADTSKWTFEFDLSGYLYHSIGGGEYAAYDSFIVKLEVDYSDGGVLEKFVKDTSYTKIDDDIQTDYLYHSKEALGGLKKAMLSLPIIASLIGLLTISTFILIRKRKK